MITAEQTAPDWAVTYIEPSPLGPVLKHPLVMHFLHMVDAGFLSWDQITEQRVAKEQECDRALADASWSKYLFLHERPYRVDALVRLFNYRNWENDLDTLGPLCTSIWIDSENHFQHRRIWPMFFAAVPGRHWMDDKDRETLKAMPDRPTIHRGGASARGYSWTRDKRVALDFARRSRMVNKPGRVYTRRVPKARVFAYVNSRNEQEVILR